MGLFSRKEKAPKEAKQSYFTAAQTGSPIAQKVIKHAAALGAISGASDVRSGLASIALTTMASYALLTSRELVYMEFDTRYHTHRFPLSSISSPSIRADGLLPRIVFASGREQIEMEISAARPDAEKFFQDLLSSLSSAPTVPAASAAPVASAADEIKKFKELLDMGAITQEEFDQKKKQLLGL